MNTADLPRVSGVYTPTAHYSAEHINDALDTRRSTMVRFSGGEVRPWGVWPIFLRGGHLESDSNQIENDADFPWSGVARKAPLLFF